MKRRSLHLRAHKISPAFWGYIILFLICFAISVAAALHHNTLNQTWKSILIWVILVPSLMLIGYWYYMKFPIISVAGNVLTLQVIWERWDIKISSIQRLQKKV